MRPGRMRLCAPLAIAAGAGFAALAAASVALNLTAGRRGPGGTGYLDQDIKISFGETIHVRDRSRAHVAAEVERKRVRRHKEAEDVERTTIVASAKRTSARPPEPKLPAAPPTPITVVQTFHMRGKVNDSIQTIPIETMLPDAMPGTRSNAAWDTAHLPNCTIKATLLDKDNKPIGEPQLCKVADDCTIKVAIPGDQAWDVSQQDIERRVTAKLPPAKPAVAKQRSGRPAHGPGKQKPTKPQRPQKSPGPRKPQQTAPQAPVPPEVDLKITPRIAAIQIELDQPMSDEYEIEAGATETFPTLDDSRISIASTQPTPAAPTRTGARPSPDGRPRPVRIAMLGWPSLAHGAPDPWQAGRRGASRQAKPAQKKGQQPATIQKLKRLPDQTITATYEVAEAHGMTPVTLTRTVADVAVKGPAGLTFDFGDAHIGPDCYRDGAYRFRAKVSEFGAGRRALTTRRELSGGVQEAVVTLPDKPNAYGENEVAAPALKLARLTTVRIAGAAGGPDAASSLPAGVYGTFFQDWKRVEWPDLPNLEDGKNRKAGTIVTPRTKGNDSGRYGRWYLYNSPGLWLHMREIQAGHGKAEPKIVVDRARLVSAEAGGVGGVTVGMTKDQVHAALGDADGAVNTTLAAHASDFGEVAKKQRELLEACDESYLDGAVRIKYEGDQVRWIEVARTAPLLLQGTTAFVRPEKTRFCVEGAGSKGANADGANFACNLLRKAGIAELSSEADAQFILTPRISVNSHVERVAHQKAMQRPARDSNGNVKRDKKGNIEYETYYVTTHYDDALVVTTTLMCDVERKDADGTRTKMTQITGVSTRSSGERDLLSKLLRAHGPDDPPIRIAPSDIPGMVERLIADDGNRGDAGYAQLMNTIYDLCDMRGRVTDVDYVANRLTVNLGDTLGIQGRASNSPLEMDIFVRTGDERDYTFVHRPTKRLYVVDPTSTGDDPAQWSFIRADAVKGEATDRLPAGAVGEMDPIGEKVSDWAEVESADAESCVVALKRKGDFGRTTDDWKAVQRVPDPSSGLVIARLRASRGDQGKAQKGLQF